VSDRNRPDRGANLPSDASLEALALEVGRALQARGMMLATAESCTGGWIAQVVTSVAGSSAWFERGFVTYSNESKHELLGVPESVLAEFGAVSEQTVRAMAEGAIRRSRANVALAVTGIAGPGGGSANKPVGTVWLAWAGNRREPVTSARRYSGDRTAVRRQTVMAALAGVITFL
jgi:nicotinamide-nucleotide amidase